MTEQESGVGRRGASAPDSTFEEREARRVADLAAGRFADLDDLDRDVAEIIATGQRALAVLRQHTADVEAEIVEIEAEIAAMNAKDAAG